MWLALTILSAIGDRHGQAECQWRLGLALIGEDRPRALTMLRAALAYRQKTRHAKALEHAAIVDRLEAEVSGFDAWTNHAFNDVQLGVQRLRARGEHGDRARPA